MATAFPHLVDLDARLAAILRRPALMGIVNITPNSFSDGTTDPIAASTHARQLILEGAALLDLGAEASSFFRPGVEPIQPDEQLRRLLPVLASLASMSSVLLSIDTRSAEVARAAIAAGAHILNDISAGEHDPAMFRTAAKLGVPIVLMHISPTYPENPPSPDPDILEAVAAYLRRRAEAAIAAGISPHRILVDPGVGFGKTPEDNLKLALEFPRIPDMPFPVVLGVSRKRFLTLLQQTPPPMLDAGLATLATHERDLATAAILRHHAGLPLRPHGLIHRVHSVTLAVRAMGIG